MSQGPRWRRSDVIFDGEFILNAGKEWHQPLDLQTGQQLQLKCVSPAPIYVTLDEDSVYQDRRKIGGIRYPFTIGTARTNQFQVYDIEKAGSYWVVVRMTGWSQGGNVHVRMELLS